MVNKVCLNCGAIFKIKNYRKDVAKYCSTLCRSDHSKATKECKFCKKKFKVWKSLFERTKFCSKSDGDVHSVAGNIGGILCTFTTGIFVGKITIG